MNERKAVCTERCTYSLVGGRWNRAVNVPRQRPTQCYKVPENAVRVSRLLAWCGNFLNTEDGANLLGILQ
jgi:hypothetical protein